MPSGEAEAEGGRVATSLCFIVATQYEVRSETLPKLIVATQYEVRSETLPKLIASSKALHKALRKALHKALHKALRKALHKVLHKALHKALRVYRVPTSPRSADLPSGKAEAEGGRVATSLCFIV